MTLKELAIASGKSESELENLAMRGKLDGLIYELRNLKKDKMYRVALSHNIAIKLDDYCNRAGQISVDEAIAFFIRKGLEND